MYAVSPFYTIIIVYYNKRSYEPRKIETVLSWIYLQGDALDQFADIVASFERRSVVALIFLSRQLVLDNGTFFIMFPLQFEL